MDKDDVNSAHEDGLLNEEVDDVTGETKNGNDALIALLQTMNKTGGGGGGTPRNSW